MMLTSSNHFDSFIPEKGMRSRITLMGLHGVRHMSCNGRGDVFWKGIYLTKIKHVTQGSHFESIQEFGLLCQHLERLGIKVSPATAVTHGAWFKTMKPDDPYKALLSRCPAIFVCREKLLLRFRRAACEFDGSRWSIYLIGSPEWRDRWLFRNLQTQGYSSESLSVCALPQVVACLHYFCVPSQLLEVMAEQLNPRSAQGDPNALD